MGGPFPVGSLPPDDHARRTAEILADAVAPKPPRRPQRPRKASYSLWLLKTTIQVLATVAAAVLVIKAAELMIIMAHLW